MFLNGTILLYLVILLPNYQILFFQNKAKLLEFGISSFNKYITCIIFKSLIYLSNTFCVFFFVGCLVKLKLLYTYGVFGGAFIARPVGGILFGIIGDRKGRKFALQLSMLLMFSATFLLGCLPGYNTIGVFAPLLLTLLRIFQGLSVGGQLVGSMLFLVGMGVIEVFVDIHEVFLPFFFFFFFFLFLLFFCFLVVLLFYCFIFLFSISLHKSISLMMFCRVYVLVFLIYIYINFQKVQDHLNEDYMVV